MGEEDTIMVTRVADEFKKIFMLSSKPSHDSVGDKYNRLFMFKLLLVTTTVVGVNQYKDSISCIIPESLDLCDGGDSCNFINAACWIQGEIFFNEALDKRVRMWADKHTDISGS